MATCGAQTRSGSACALVAGWGTSHKGEGRCKHHETQAEPPRSLGGRVARAPEYAISDGVNYTLPRIHPTFALQSKPAMSTWVELTQQQTMRFQFDAPNRSAYDAPVWMPIDDPLQEWDFATRLDVWTNCHAAYHRNPLAKQAVNITRQFAVGKGHTVTARNKAVQDVIDRFRANEDNAVDEYDKTFVNDLQVDGELIIRKFAGGPDGSVIVPIPPWHIDDIETEPGFFRRVTNYHMQYFDNTTGEFYEEDIKPNEVLFVAINRHSYELRGRSDLFTVLPWLRAYKEWLENRARQNKWRNTLLWDVSIEGNGAQVDAAANKYSTPPTDGSIVAHSSKEVWQPLTNPVGAGDAAEDGRQIKLMAAVGFGLPEYMLSDGENANLASATAQELPALWKFVDVQDIMAERVWKPIYKWVIQQAIDNNELPEMVTVEDADGEAVKGDNEKAESVKAIDAFTVDYPELTEDDPKTLAEALQIAGMNGWISDEGARTVIAGKFGLDPNVEKKRVAREKEEMRDEVAQGLRNDPTLMRGNGQQTGQQRGDQPQNANGQRVAPAGGAVGT